MMIKKCLIILMVLSSCVAIKPSERIAFIAPDSYPEGIAYDKSSNIFYVSSMRDGTIGKVTRQGAYSILHHDSTLKSSYGLKIHPDGKRLFACIGDANYSRLTSADTRKKMARIISIDLASGKRLTDIDLSSLVSSKHFPNDMAFDDKGNIYVTDSYAHTIYKVTPEGNASVFSQHPKFKTEGIGINGIVVHPDGFLLVDNSNTGRIYKVSTTNPQDVSIVGIEQYFLGSDGLILNDKNTLTMVVNGGNDKIYQLSTEDNWKSAKLKGTTLIAERFSYPAP